jgi:hypothetical protein
MKRKQIARFVAKFALTLAGAAMPGQVALGQDLAPTFDSIDFDQDRVLSRTFATMLWSNPDPDDSSTASRSARIRMFRMLPGFISDPLGLGGLDDDPPDPEQPPPSAGPDHVTFGLGLDNPYLEPRWARDPGGPGYYRIYTQAQIIDAGGMCVALGLQAWTPAGIENGGVAQGPTYFTPGIGLFQDLGMGLGLHAFADEQIHGIRQTTQMHCGVALQAPLSNWDTPENQTVFAFVQALGNSPYLAQRVDRDMNWQCMPGVCWRVSDCFTLSVGAARQSLVTCGWQY